MYGAQNRIMGATLGPSPDAMRNAVVEEKLRDVPAIGQALDRLDKAISSLDEVLTALHGRLMPVRRENPTSTPDINPSSPGNSPICYAVVGHAARVEALRDHALRMLEELEI